MPKIQHTAVVRAGRMGKAIAIAFAGLQVKFNSYSQSKFQIFKPIYS